MKQERMLESEELTNETATAFQEDKGMLHYVQAPSVEQ